MKRLALAVLVAAAAFVPRAISLDRVVTFDETLWLERSQQFTAALSDLRFSDTVRSGHPGVTTMWIAGLAQETLPADATIRQRLARGRLGMAVADAALIALAWWIALGLMGAFAAALGAALVALDPFLIAHNRLVHIDGLLSLAMLASILALLRAIRSGDQKWVVASGALAGVAGLTKVAAGFLVVAAIVAFVRSDRTTAVRRTAVWAGSTAATMVVLWPAMWVAPWKAISRMAVGAGGAASANPGGRLLAGGSVVDSVLFYPATLLWRSTILTLPALVATVVWARIRRKNEAHDAAALLLYAFGFAVFTAVGLKRADRYLLPSMIAADVALAIGIAHALRGKARPLSVAAIAAACALHAAPALATHPYEIASYNWAVGGAPSARATFTLGFGEGLDQMAAELNRLPGATALTVGSTHLSPFAELFAGRTIRILDSDVAHPDGERVDLVLFYISSVQSDRYPEFALWRRFRSRTPLRTVTVNGIPYARVYAVQR